MRKSIEPGSSGQKDGRYGFGDSENGDFSIRFLKYLFVFKISTLVADWTEMRISCFIVNH